MVPIGVRDEPQVETVKLFCPKCQDVYVHPSHAAQSELVDPVGVLSCSVASAPLRRPIDAFRSPAARVAFVPSPQAELLCAVLLSNQTGCRDERLCDRRP